MVYWSNSSLVGYHLPDNGDLTSDFTDPDDCSSTLFTVATLLGSLLGTLGSVALILTSLRHDLCISMSKKIIFMISLADILQAFPTLVVACIQMYEEQHGADKCDILSWLGYYGCKWQSAVITVGAMLTFLWTFGLSQHIYLLLRFGIQVAHTAYRMLHVLSIIPFGIIMASFYFDVLGIDVRKTIGHSTDSHEETYHLSWCWINVTKESENSGPFLKQSCPAAMYNGKGFEIFAYLGVTIYCTLAWRRYKQLMDNYAPINGGDDSEVLPNDSNPLAAGSSLRINKILLIPVMFIVCRIWGTISRLSCLCTLDSAICNNHILITLQNFFDPLQGFVNFMLFKILSAPNSCECGCLTAVRARIRPPQQNRSVEPVTVWVHPESSEYSEF